MRQTADVAGAAEGARYRITIVSRLRLARRRRTAWLSDVARLAPSMTGGSQQRPASPSRIQVDPTHAIPFVEPTFGLPPDGASLDHAQGYVAEVTWRMLAREEQLADRSILHLERPDSDVTAPGADGFVIYRTCPGIGSLPGGHEIGEEGDKLGIVSGTSDWPVSFAR